jgi:signal transduction histidine kinase
MTAHRRREKRLDGISAGARDFLLKPLDLPDLRIRLRNAGEMKRLYDQSQEQLRTITELESFRDSLVHMIVHDLKSPLTMVLGNLELMGLFLPKEISTDAREAIDGCQQGARKMNEMVSSILTVSKLESGKMELDLAEAPIVEVTKEAIKLLGPRSDRVRVLAADELSDLKVQMDVGLIQRVITNLLSNALDHSPETEPVVIQISPNDGATQMVVLDRGPGVPEEFKERIFEKFSQVDDGKRVRKGSVGLGLAFCKLAVEAHSGIVGVDNREEGGSAFWFRLPGR